MRSKMQTALNARTTMTKNGISINVLQARKKAEKKTAAMVPNDKRFYSNGLSRNPIVPPVPVVMRQLTPTPATKPGAGPTPSPPALSTNDVVERKSKLRRQIGNSIFSANASSQDQENKNLHKRLLTSTPNNTVETLIGDSIAMGHNTPTTLDYLKRTL
jgi:hypothetical protein